MCNTHDKALVKSSSKEMANEHDKQVSNSEEMDFSFSLLESQVASTISALLRV